MILVSKFTQYQPMNDMIFRRPVASLLEERLREQPRHVQILAGPRQVGKTTLIRQVLADRPLASFHSAAADDPSREASFSVLAQTVGVEDGRATTQEWLQQQWRRAEAAAQEWNDSGPQAKNMAFVLVLDEVQLVPQWSGVVKGLWDASRARNLGMHVVLLGSAPLLMQQGLTESLAGRYELLRMGHWSFDEMHEAFDFTLDQYVYFGGYPGSAVMVADETRWRGYVTASLVEPNIQKDVLAMTRVDRPALLRQLFELGCAYSGQVLSLDKIRGQLGGHTDTLSHHLTLLDQAGLLRGLQKYAAQAVRQRASPPKFQVHNNALMTVSAGYGFDEARADRSHWGRLVESAVGAHLINTAGADTRVHYWRERDMEVDFVIEHRGRLAAIEVKTKPDELPHRGTVEFCRRHPEAKRVLVGGPTLPLGEFLRAEAASWVR